MHVEFICYLELRGVHHRSNIVISYINKEYVITLTTGSYVYGERVFAQYDINCFVKILIYTQQHLMSTYIKPNNYCSFINVHGLHVFLN